MKIDTSYNINDVVVFDIGNHFNKDGETIKMFNISNNNRIFIGRVRCICINEPNEVVYSIEVGPYNDVETLSGGTIYINILPEEVMYKLEKVK